MKKYFLELLNFSFFFGCFLTIIYLIITLGYLSLVITFIISYYEGDLISKETYEQISLATRISTVVFAVITTAFICTFWTFFRYCSASKIWRVLSKKWSQWFYDPPITVINDPKSCRNIGSYLCYVSHRQKEWNEQLGAKEIKVPIIVLQFVELVAICSDVIVERFFDEHEEAHILRYIKFMLILITVMTVCFFFVVVVSISIFLFFPFSYYHVFILFT